MIAVTGCLGAAPSPRIASPATSAQSARGVSGSDDQGGGSDERPPAGIIRPIEPFDPAPSIEAATRTLDANGVAFALIGGLALGAWGIARVARTLVLAVPVGAAEPAAEQLVAGGGQKRPLRIGGMAIRDPDRNLRIDLIDRRFHLGALFRDAIAEAHAAQRFTRAGQIAVPLASLEHLTAMKMASGEPKDDADVRRILQLEQLDYRRARALVEAHLGFATANRLDTMAREAGRPEVQRRLYQNGDEMDE